MIRINTEYRKGILFVRFIGRIDCDDYINWVDNLINDFGIRCVVFNLNDLNYVSLENIDHIMKYYYKMLKKKKFLFICDSNLGRCRLFKNIIPKVSSELETFSLI